MRPKCRPKRPKVRDYRSCNIRAIPRAGSCPISLKFHHFPNINLAPKCPTQMPQSAADETFEGCITSRRGFGMSSLDHYRAKAQELRAKSQSEGSPINKAVFEGLAKSYIRLARLEENHQREVRQKAWAHSASETGWTCECGQSISLSEREIYFTTRRCMHCNQAANERLSRPYDLASSESYFASVPGNDHSERSRWMLAASKFFSPLLGKSQPAKRRPRSGRQRAAAR
jgi:RNA polymerase-binding transcription factor DksA